MDEQSRITQDELQLEPEILAKWAEQMTADPEEVARWAEQMTAVLTPSPPIRNGADMATQRQQQNGQVALQPLLGDYRFPKTEATNPFATPTLLDNLAPPSRAAQLTWIEQMAFGAERQKRAANETHNRLGYRHSHLTPPMCANPLTPIASLSYLQTSF
jgi:hypothetical protein